MRVLHLEIDGCMSCPCMAIVGDLQDTIIACKHKKSGVGVSRFNARTILKQPMSYVVADVEIPEWCPLPIMNKIEVIQDPKEPGEPEPCDQGDCHGKGVRFGKNH